ncbi:MAG TPA: DNA repair exonuclease [Candidatus Scatomorpha merdipullorum]|uniref:DNA repair exonuclease n=1 Tax=Candidatus Scatomorpha merdipullorum TaxID=2840927 RepID=A0A9D1FBY1_9FIRM|nr:DNA repair exonuclease [Candidatus Scatomorpha merdipullorum]
MIRVLHAADLHLDSPFDALSEEKAVLRRAEQRELLRSLAGLRAEQGADLVLLSGDLFDSDAVWAETGEFLRLTLAEMAVPVFIAPGNHDYYRAGGRWERLSLPDNVRVFTSPDFDCEVLNDMGVRVWGAAFTDNYCEGKLAELRIPRQDGFTELVCLHGEVGAAASRYNPMTEAEIAATSADYLALGHNHGFSGLRKAGSTYYAWPGCPEGRGFDECGEKGIIVADVEPGSVKARFIPTAARRYERLSVPADALGSFRLPEGAERNIYEICVTGETEHEPDLAALRRALEPRVFALRLRDETRLRRDVWERAGEDSLRGVFLRMLREKYDGARTEAEREEITRAARWGLAALDGREEAEPLW